MKKTAPIGIFDSGIGGLTVANAIQKELPNEQLIYFGDIAHLPYGDKSTEAIKTYSKHITQFLLEKECKAIIIACNTASALAYQEVKRIVNKQALVINVIDPIVNYISNKYTDQKVGIIGTKGTIKSRVYVRKIKKINPTIDVTSLATPLLAPMIEEGFFNNKISQTIINNYLSTKSFKKINALVLGCTHYPLIKKEVENYYNGNCEIIDSAQIVAHKVKERLNKTELINPYKTSPHHFFVSDYTKAFEQSARLFFKGKIKLENINIWQ